MQIIALIRKLHKYLHISIKIIVLKKNTQVANVIWLVFVRCRKYD